VQEGVLKFQDKRHLRDVARLIKDEDKSSSFEGKSNFRSLLARQNAVTEADVDKISETRELGEFSDLLVLVGKDDDLSLDPIVGDKRYAALFNEQSIVIVGDSAYHIGYLDQSAIEIATQPEKLREFKQNPDMAGTTHTKIVRERISIPNARTSGVMNGDVITSMYRVGGGGKWYRFFAQFDRNYAGVYTSLAVKVRHQRRNFMVWSLYGTTKVGFVNGWGSYWKANQIDVRTWSGSLVTYGASECVDHVGENYAGPFDSMGWISGSADMSCIGLNGEDYNATFTP